MFIVVVCLFLVSQLIRPARTNPLTDQSLSLESQLQIDPKVATILERSCNDCHSNETRWPWYSNVAPVSWWMVGHVNDGRHDLNFSEWGTYDKRKQNRRLDQMCELAKSGAMPLASYTPMHSGSKLSGDDLRMLCVWTNAQANAIAVRTKRGSVGSLTTRCLISLDPTLPRFGSDLIQVSRIIQRDYPNKSIIPQIKSADTTV
jgi:hypothetical protein